MPPELEGAIWGGGGVSVRPSVPIWKVLLTMVRLPLGSCEWCGHLTLPTSVFVGYWSWAAHWQITKSPALTEPLRYIGSSSASLPYSGPHFIQSETGILRPLPAAATVSSSGFRKTLGSLVPPTSYGKNVLIGDQCRFSARTTREVPDAHLGSILF